MKVVRILTVLFSLVLFAGLTAGQSGSSALKQAPKTEMPAAALIDINRATLVELKTLPGIGDAYSNAIVRNRPYKNKTQLRSKSVIPPATYDKIKDLIVAKQ